MSSPRSRVWPGYINGDNLPRFSRNERFQRSLLRRGSTMVTTAWTASSQDLTDVFRPTRPVCSQLYLPPCTSPPKMTTGRSLVDQPDKVRPSTSWHHNLHTLDSTIGVFESPHKNSSEYPQSVPLSPEGFRCFRKTGHYIPFRLVRLTL